MSLLSNKRRSSSQSKTNGKQTSKKMKTTDEKPAIEVDKQSITDCRQMPFQGI